MTVSTKRSSRAKRRTPKGRVGPKKWLRKAALYLAAYGLITGLLAGATALLLDSVIMPKLVKQGVESEIPDVTGMDYVAAAEILNDHGFDPRRVGEEPDPELPKGMVVSQEPAAGRMGKPLRPVRLVVSAGPAQVVVPAMIGLGCREALNKLTTRGLRTGDIIMAESHRTVVGKVLASTPREGTALLLGAEVDLLVAGPPHGAAYLMPSLEGRGVRETFRVLKGIGIGVSSRRYVRGSDEKEGTVLSIHPPPGFRICAGESVAVVVSSS